MKFKLYEEYIKVTYKSDIFLSLWLDSNLSFSEFLEKHRGRLTGKKFGI
jgi:hypothetical protein